MYPSILHAIHSMQGVSPRAGVTRAGREPDVPEALVVATALAAMARNPGALHPRVRWLFQEALKSLAVN